MDARLAKIRERKQRKLREAGLLDNTQEVQTQEDSTKENNTQEDNIQEKNTQEKTGEMLSLSGEGEETEGDESEKFIGTMIHRIRNKSTKIDKAHLNEWEKGKVGKKLLFSLYLIIFLFSHVLTIY